MTCRTRFKRLAKIFRQAPVRAPKHDEASAMDLCTFHSLAMAVHIIHRESFLVTAATISPSWFIQDPEVRECLSFS